MCRLGTDTISPMERLGKTEAIVLLIVFGIMRIMETLHMLLVQFLFYITVVCFWKEYGYLTRKLKLLVQTGKNISERMEELRCQHQRLTNVFCIAGAFLKNFTLIVFSATISAMCCVLYGLIMGELSGYDLAILIQFMTVVLHAKVYNVILHFMSQYCSDVDYLAIIFVRYMILCFD